MNEEQEDEYDEEEEETKDAVELYVAILTYNQIIRMSKLSVQPNPSGNKLGVPWPTGGLLGQSKAP